MDEITHMKLAPSSRVHKLFKEIQAAKGDKNAEETFTEMVIYYARCHHELQKLHESFMKSGIHANQETLKEVER